MRATALNLDGGGGTDLYHIFVNATSDYIINTHDTGASDDGVDHMIVEGTSGDDTFLLRHNFVAALHDDGTGGFANDLERITSTTASTRDCASTHLMATTHSSSTIRRPSQRSTAAPAPTRFQSASFSPRCATRRPGWRWVTSSTRSRQRWAICRRA